MLQNTCKLEMSGFPLLHASCDVLLHTFYVALPFACKHALGHVKDGLNFLNAQSTSIFFFKKNK
jgi:hypothetical protein